MSLSNTALEYFDHNVLRLPEKRKEYHAQVDNLVSELKKRITDKSKLKVKKVVKAGSFAKYTILRKIDDYPTDVDVVFTSPVLKKTASPTKFCATGSTIC